MKLCASYKISRTMWDQVDELRFSVQALSQAITYLEEHSDKRIIIEVLDLDVNKLTVEKIHDLIDEYPSLYFDFYHMTDLLNIADSRRHYMYHYPANTYNMLYMLLQLPISDVVIGEPLTFDLKNLKQFIQSQEYPVVLRVLPALGRPDLFNQIKDVDDGFRHFWILPQHVSIYDPYIDVLDVYDENVTREETLVRLFQKGEFNNSIKFYLKNGDCDLRSDLIDAELLNRRLNCNQKCFQNKCHFCDAYTSFLLLVKEKEKGSYYEESFENSENK